MSIRSFQKTSGFFWLILTLVLSACTPAITSPTAAASTAPAAVTATPAPVEAAVVFSMRLAEGVAGGDLYLDVASALDDVFLPLQRHPLEEQADGSYAVGISATPGEVVRYRFSRGDDQTAVETTCNGQPASLRTFLVSGEDISLNVVCGWGEPVYKGGLGRVSGVVSDAVSGEPISGAVVQVAGQRAITAADGSYLIEGLAPGTHNLYASAPDGSYMPFQQGARIAEESNTPAQLEMRPSHWVNVTFQVSAPPSDLPSLPIRIIGNTAGLGNSASSLVSGVTAPDAAQAPLLTRQEDGRYALTLKLPAGFDLRYRYTLGNSLWNGERDTAGVVATRQLIVPAKDITLDEEIIAWQMEDLAPVTFQLRAPADLPGGDSVAIQFGREGLWTQPINMWPLGGGNWYFILYSPVEKDDDVRYRYCHNGLCDGSGDAQTAGTKALGQRVAFKSEPQNFSDSATDWSTQAAIAPTEAPAESVGKVREGLFYSGVELQPWDFSGWQQTYPGALRDIQAMHAGWVTLTPEWQFTSQNPPVLEMVTGQTLFEPEMQQVVDAARAQNLHVAFYPQAVLPTGDTTVWWQGAHRDADWWARWFEQYRRFALHYAAWAQQMNVEMLILGGPGVEPALPGYAFANNTETGLPDDAAGRWRALITDVRAVYKGQVLWAVDYATGLKTAPEWLDAVDQVYLLWSAPLAKAEDASAKDLAAQVTKLFKQNVLPLQKKFNKPVLLGVSYPSADGALTGCVKLDGACASSAALDAPLRQGDANFDAQAAAYRAVLKVISREDHRWVSGMFARGYYAPVALVDSSNSVRGKPAEALLAAWFAAFR